MFVPSDVPSDEILLSRRGLIGLGLAVAGARALGPLAPPALAAAGRPRAVSLALDLPYARRIGPVRIPGRLELAGLRWPGHAHVSAQIRVRRRGGRWGDWLALAHAHDHGPDGDPVSGTDPVWTGPADEVELRLSRPLRGLTLHGVRTHDARRSFATRGRAHAAQAGGPPPIIPRAAWGGDSVPPRTAPELGQVQLAFVHHTVNSNDYGPADSAAMVLAIAHYHRDTNGWNDIGYNFLVDRYGQIFEGRAGGIDQAIVGAQAQGYNSNSTGVANLGTFTSVPETPEAMDAMARLIAWKLGVHGVPVEGAVTVRSLGGPTNRYASGRPVTFQRIAGHRDGDQTECPGDALYAQLPDLRARAAAYAAAPADRLTLASSSVRLVAPQRTAALNGLLLAPAGAPIAGVPVQLQALQSAGWATVAQPITDAAGAYAIDIDLWRTTRLRAVYAGPEGSASSPALAIAVAPAVKARASAKRVRAGRSVRVSYAVSPARTRVVLDIARQVGRGRYVRVGSVRTRARQGRGAASIRLRRAGLYRVVVRAPGDAHAAEGRAPWLFVRATHH